LETGGCNVLVIGMVTSPDPQSKVMMPPLVMAASSASKVQLAAVPVPTTVVGLEVSASVIWLGRGSVLQEPSGLPADGNAPASPPSLGEAPDDELAPLLLDPDDAVPPPELEETPAPESSPALTPFDGVPPELHAAARARPKAAKPRTDERMTASSPTG
jgi:hypothetical protein